MHCTTSVPVRAICPASSDSDTNFGSSCSDEASAMKTEHAVMVLAWEWRLCCLSVALHSTIPLDGTARLEKQWISDGSIVHAVLYLGWRSSGLATGPFSASLRSHCAAHGLARTAAGPPRTQAA
jgi:hypothetical protein